MKISTQLVSAFVSTVAIALSSTVLPQAASAQTAPGTPGSATSFPDSSRQNERGSMSGGFGGGDFNVFDLIHQSQLGTLRDINEFSQEQNQNLTTEAEKFRLEQRRRLGTPPQLQPEGQQENQGQTAPVGN